MTEKLQQIAREKISKLPAEWQAVINSCDWAGISEEIGKKYLPLQSQIDAMQTEILLVLIGLVDPNLLPEAIETFVENTTKEESEKIAEEIAEKILVPIGDRLEENIKKSEKVGRAGWEQNLNFVLSGGNYSAFLEKPTEE